MKIESDSASAAPASGATQAPAAIAAPADSINLRDPFLAGVLAWLIPGAGHFYQRRWGKGGLFMVCILGTFFFGLWMGQGRVVYASWRPNDQRYPYICQVGVGLPALPAIAQSIRMKSELAPLWDGFEAPPLLYEQRVPRAWAESRVKAGEFDATDFPDLARNEPPNYVRYMKSDVSMNDAPKEIGINMREPYNQLSDWNYKMGPFFELGTVYTLIAGLLNILAIYDACCGPVGAVAAAPTPSSDKKPEA